LAFHDNVGMNDDSPYFSIIIPTRERPGPLRRCLEAVAALDYPADRYEVIVVDDGGVPPLDDLIARFSERLRIRWVRQPRAGFSAARNAGAALAQGDYLAFTDDDCLPDPGWLRAFAAIFERVPEALLGGATREDRIGKLIFAISEAVLAWVCGEPDTRSAPLRFAGASNLSVSAALFPALASFSAARQRQTAADLELCQRWQAWGGVVAHLPEAQVARRRRWPRPVAAGLGVQLALQAWRRLFKPQESIPAAKQTAHRAYQPMPSASPKPPAHFLHIGKTGGTAAYHALCLAPPGSGDYRILSHTHAVKLSDIPTGEKVFFFLRDPISRFVSGFYSRQRQGKPRYFYPWSHAEKLAFEHFQTPNQLATALTSKFPKQRALARMAMAGIHHVNTTFWDWFHDEEYWRSRASDILFVGYQETLAQDFEKLKSLLGLPPELGLPKDAIDRHESPPSLDKALDDLALANLREWYRRDYAFLERCPTKG
jgi:hypothetical protein